MAFKVAAVMTEFASSSAAAQIMLEIAFAFAAADSGADWKGTQQTRSSIGMVSGLTHSSSVSASPKICLSPCMDKQ